LTIHIPYAHHAETMRLSASAVLVSLLALKLSPVMAQTTAKPRQPVLGHRSATLLKVDGLQFKDLNHNGKLDLYEDWRKPAAVRAADLVGQMSVEDLAGAMLQGTLPALGGAEASIGRGSGYDLARSKEMIDGKRINTFITRLGGDPTRIATSNNALQEIAEATRFGIPLTISTDPRNNFLYTSGASVEAGSFSKWPETTGMAAINDPALTRRYADTVRREYLAVGIREALSPQADLATEPRWARLNGTFGEDADVARAQVKAYVEGMQNGASGLNSGSVITVVKHWVGYGAQKDGWDSHNFYGRYSALTNAQLPYHVKPFLGAFEANVAAVMPTYSILENITVDGKPIEQVGAGYSRDLLTGMLRGKYGFKGVVISDWGITTDCSQQCREGMPAGQRATPAQIAMSWGVMDLARSARFAKSINAGVDQIGGTEDVEALLAAARSGDLKEPRMREAATRILQQKFETGAFENPYVDADAAKQVVGNPASLAAAEDAQKRAMVPLENRAHTVPVRAGVKVWLFHVDPTAARAAGLTVVDTPETADVVIIRAETPSELLHPGYFFGSRQHEGRLNFQAGDAAYDALQKAGSKPVVMTVYMDRPAILTEVRDKVAALYADFGVSDTALLEVLMGKARAQGHLPFELPGSMAAVAAQSPGAAHDSAKPLYPFGYALK
jgi:beta-glucosidase